MSQPGQSVTTLDHSTPCLRCGYDLIGLASNGTCPECASPVERSLRGDWLRYSSDDYRLFLLRGVTFIMAGIVVSVISMFAGIPLLMALGFGGSLVAGALGLVGSGLSYYGYFLFSTPDPGQLTANKGETPRRVLRICIAIAAASAIVQFVFSLVRFTFVLGGAHAIDAGGSGLLNMFVALAGVLAWIVQFFAAMLYTMWLAPRIPSEKVFKRAKLLIWLGPLLFLAYCTVIAPLAALILYYNMFGWIRKELITLQMELALTDQRSL